MREFLEDLIKEAGVYSLEFRQRLKGLKVVAKSKKDLVSEADQKIEALICSRISEAFPEHGILGEETGESMGTCSKRWIIDPIDGTASFVHGQPFYSISIAYEEEGEVLLGAVYAPVFDECFIAEKGKGAYLNGEKLTVSAEGELVQSIMATGFACLRSELEENNLPYFNALMPKMRDVRRYGSAALDCAYVAAGRLEGFWELNLNLYDVAAGLLLVQEAGGRVSDYDGKKLLSFEHSLVTNGLIHDQVLEIFAQLRQK